MTTEWTTLDPDNEDHAKIIAEHKEGYEANNETIERLATKYGVDANRAGQVSLVLEHLIDYIVGPGGSVERAEYEISYEDMFAERLHGVEVSVSAQKFRKGLHVPKQGGIHLP
jgi:hypothetical protein